jgi:NADH-quinone oxidoreductase subunit B
MSQESSLIVPPRSQVEVPEELKRNILVAGVDTIYNWARHWSMWPAMFGLACCAIEMVVTVSARHDLARFGAEFMRPSPRQADMMIVAGTVTKKMAPQVVRIYEQMAEPKYVLAMGACSISGGTFKSYAVVQGVDLLIPVDVYIPGCPPRPEALIYGIMKMMEKVDHQSILNVPWYNFASKRAAKEAAAGKKPGPPRPEEPCFVAPSPDHVIAPVVEGAAEVLADTAARPEEGPAGA